MEKSEDSFEDVSAEDFKDNIICERFDEEHKESIEQLRMIIESVGEGITYSDEKGHFEIYNSKMQEITGYTIDEVNNFDDFITILYPNPNELKKSLDTIHEVVQNGKSQNVETAIQTKDGKEKTLLVSTSMIRYRNRDMFLSIYADISERKQVEYDLSVMKNAIASSINAIAIAEIDGRLTYANPSFIQMWGYKDDNELIGTPLVEFWRRKGKYVEVLDALMNNGGWVGELVAERDDGSTFNVELSASTVKSEKNEPICMMASFVDITERKKAETELENSKRKIELQNIQLRRLDRIKSDFLNVTSHELRTPMSAIKGYVQMILKQTLGNVTPEQITALNVVLRNTDRLDHLIQDILDISRLESCTMKFIPEETNIKKLIDETVETMQSSAGIKNIKINGEVEDRIITLTIDQERIKQVIINLINNAIKFSPEDSNIFVRAKKECENILFEVQDFGRGIPINKQQKIFETFYQVDSGMDRKFGGAGLGLAISRGIILAHGGQIGVESTVGEGSIFRFTLPMLPVTNVEARFKEVDVFKFKNDEEDLESKSKMQNINKNLQISEESIYKGSTHKNDFIHTDIKRTIKKLDLKNLGEIYQTVFENSAVAIMVTDENEKIMYWNEYAEDLLGFNKVDLFMQPVKSLYPSEEWERIRSQNIRQKGMHHHLDIKILRKNNEPLDIDLSLSVLKDHMGKIVGSIGVIKDISERKKMEKNLEESKRKFMQLYDSAPIPYHTLLPNGIITNVNEKWCRTLGYTKEDVIGKSIFDFIVKEQRKEAELSFENKIKSGKSYIKGHNRNFLTKDGEEKMFVINDFLSLNEDMNVTSVHTTMLDVNELYNEFREKEITKYNLKEKKLIESINKLQESQIKIERENNKLKKLDEIRSAFLNVTSHELRTPMSSIKGYVQMFLRLSLGEITEEQRKGLEVILRNANRLDHLIQDILDISRLESCTMKFIPEETNIKKLIDETVETMQSSADLKHIKINTDIEDNMPELTIDQERIKQVIINFISNAIKFSSDGAIINTRMKKERNDVLFEIHDFGRGIPKDKQLKIFEIFYQVESSKDTKFGGAGLGLAISRGIILAHGGRIWVESIPGKGSTFKFTLPIKPVVDMENRFKEVDVFKVKNST